MRCTKCGYISFDHLENCRKCRKPINDADAGLNGTVFEAEAPAFLKFALPDQADEVAVDDTFEDSFDEFGEPDDFLIDEEGNDDQDAVELEDIMIDPVEEEADDEIILDLDALDDAAPSEEFSLNADAEEEIPEEENESPAIDFGDLDISDLAPPEMKEDEKEAGAEAPAETGDGLDSLVLNLEDDTVPPASAPAKESRQGMGGLEDLLVDQLDLDKIDKPALGKRSAKPVKTGTALDSFDIDLGDLFTDKK